MGTIASVLQWRCQSCGLLNCGDVSVRQCSRCRSPYHDKINKEDDITDLFGSNATCTVIRRRPKHRSPVNKSDSYGAAHQSDCDSAGIAMDGGCGGNKSLRTTSSGINCNGSDSAYDAPLPVYKNYWRRGSGNPPGVTWTCKRCTLLNNSNSVFCEACEAPFHHQDFNSNISPSVLIKETPMIVLH